MSAQQKQLQALLETHVDFELGQWRGKTLKKRLKEESHAFWVWAESITLDEFSNAERVSDIARRLVVEMPLPEDITDIFGTIAKHLIPLQVNRETSVAEVIDAEVFDDGVELLVNLKHLREEVIRQSVNSPIYATLVMEILYNGIRDYLSSENMLTQKMPGVGKLINKGAGAISKRIPDLEERLRTNIEKNLQRTIRDSEDFLYKALNDERIRQLAADVWDAIQDSNLSVADFLNDEEVDGIVAYVFEFWLHLRETDYLAELMDEAIAKFFEEYGDHRLSELLCMVGVTRKLIEKETLEVGVQLAEVLEQSGYIEATIRRRLEPFYSSKQAAAALA